MCKQLVCISLSSYISLFIYHSVDSEYSNPVQGQTTMTFRGRSRRNKEDVNEVLYQEDIEVSIHMNTPCLLLVSIYRYNLLQPLEPMDVLAYYSGYIHMCTDIHIPHMHSWAKSKEQLHFSVGL